MNHTFSSHTISLSWHFLAWHKPPLSQRNTSRARNLQGISKLENKGWLLLVLWQLLKDFPSTLCTWSRSGGFPCFAQCNSAGLPCYEILRSRFLNKPQPVGVSKSVPRDFISLISCCTQPPRIGAQWVWRAWVGADHSASFSRGHLVLQVSWGLCSWHHDRVEYPWRDTWRYLLWNSSSAISSPF
jgi:hypothetical protein